MSRPVNCTPINGRHIRQYNQSDRMRGNAGNYAVVYKKQMEKIARSIWAELLPNLEVHREPKKR